MQQIAIIGVFFGYFFWLFFEIPINLLRLLSGIWQQAGQLDKVGFKLKDLGDDVQSGSAHSITSR